ncbi:MAG: SDR family NAD(P)-dependent oxidoreductase [Rectinemataceae bacterium]
MESSSGGTTTHRIIITGGTRGIGAGLVRAFAGAGWEVHFSGRSEASVKSAMEGMPIGLADRVSGHACAADDAEGLSRLWEGASREGRVDVVLCNAGISHSRPRFTDHSPQELRDVVVTNLLGPMVAAQVLIPRLEAQGGGYFYGMEGYGSGGQIQAGMNLYGSSKYALAYLLRALAAESAGSKVAIGALSPGMVVTDLLLSGEGGLAGISTMDAGRKRIFNILADRVETVAPWLAARVMEDVDRGGRPGRLTRHDWLTTPKILARFLTAGIAKRNVIEGAS